MKTETLKGLVLAALLLGGNGGALQAQQYSIGWSKIGGGGGTASGGQYSTAGTIGQADAGGPFTDGQYTLNVGFWEGAQPGNCQTNSCDNPCIQFVGVSNLVAYTCGSC